MAHPPEIRELCNKIREHERKIDELQREIDLVGQKEKTSSPIIRNIYEIISRCFTLLLDMQRFSNLLILGQVDNRNDFVKCSIVIKNFANYFESVSSQLKKNGIEVAKLKKKKQEMIQALKTEIAECEKLSMEIENKAQEFALSREENIIQTDVVCHLAMKSESLEELDAGLEAENTVGVLKNTKVASDLVLVPPVVGKIVEEFGDTATNGEMTHYMAFEADSSAIVTSPAKGYVVFSGKFLNYGNILVISNGEYRVYLYGMDVLFASTGDIVEIGDYVGKTMKDNKSVIKMELKKFGEMLNPRHWMQKTAEEK
jgi:murein DD-endopeptidase MepM/ murein hydrolase activator NlpD